MTQVGRENQPRQPFRMLAGRHAQSRYDWVDSRGRELHAHKSGRASFVWLYGVLVPLACGVTDLVEVSQGPDMPWHQVTGSDDAYRQIIDHYPLQGGLKRMVRTRRLKKGLSI